MGEYQATAVRAREVLDRLLFIQDMHSRLRCWHPGPNTPEGHFIDENTVVRLAAMMEWAEAKPSGSSRCAAEAGSDDGKSVRTLFLFRNLIMHGDAGHLVLDGPRRTDAEKASFEWFCKEHPAARVAPGEYLCLDATEVISPLLDGCIVYLSARGKLPQPGQGG